MARLSLWRNNYVLLFLIYIVALVLFVAFSYKIIFHDTWEYVALAKKFAGFLNSDVFIVHSLVYPWFLSFFLKVFPSFLTMKVVNLSWIILTGLLLYKSGLKKTSFLMWVFSPIAWIASPIISPVLPASFFLLVAYLSIKRWQENKKSPYFIISALALGLSVAFCDIALILAIFFILTFFYDKKFKEVIVYSLFTIVSFSIRLMLDANLFSLAIKDKLIPFPFYSLIRFWGAISIINLGLHPIIPISKLSILLNIHSWNFLILISPLLFYFYKIKYKEHKRVIIFLILSSIFFIYQGGGYFYFILLAPIITLLLSEVFKRKELIIHIISSVLIIIFMTYPFFILDKPEIEKRNLIIKDLKMINNEFHFDKVVFKTDTLAMFYIWDKSLPYFISSEERDKVLNGDNYYSQYIFELKPKIDTDKILEVKAGLKVNFKKDINYETIPWLIEKGQPPPEGYKSTKCYNLLCVYQKS